MAESKSLKEAVNEIKENTKHFGTKMPGDGNLEKEMDMQGLTYSQMIMGSIASLVWGKLSVKDEDKVKSLLSSPNNIYKLIETISKDAKKTRNVNVNNISDKVQKILLSTFGEALTTGLDDYFAFLYGHIVSNRRELIKELDNIKLSKFAEAINKILNEKEKTLLKLAVNFQHFFEKEFAEIKPDDKKTKSEITGTSKILIDVKSIDTLKELVESFNKIDSFPFFDNDNIVEVNKILSGLEELTDDIFLSVSFKDLEDAKKELDQLKINIYDPNELDNLNAFVESLKEPIELRIDQQPLENFKRELDQLNINIYDPNELNNLNAFIESLKEPIELHIDQEPLENFKKICEEIESIKLDENTKTVLGAISEFFDKLKQSLKKEDVKKIKDETLPALIEFFTGRGTKTDKSLKDLIDAIKIVNTEINKDENGTSFDNLANIFKIVEIASNLMEGHDKTPNEKFFKSLTKIMTDERYLKGLVLHINELGKTIIDDRVEDNIDVINDVIDMVSKIGELGILRLFKTKLNIKLINKFLINDIRELISNVKDFESSDEDTDEAFNTLNNVFDAITKLGELEIKKKRKMKKNLTFIKEYVIGEIKNLITDNKKGIPSIANGQKEAFELMEKTSSLFESLINIGKLGEDNFDKQLDESEYKLEMLKEFITSDIKEFFNDVKESFKELDEETLKSIIDKIDNIEDVFGSIIEVNEALPSMGSIFKANIKLMLLNVEFNTIQHSMEMIKSIMDSVTKEITNFLSKKFPTTIKNIGKINELLGSINTQDGIKSILGLDEELAYLYWCTEYMQEIANSFGQKINFSDFGDTIKSLNKAIEKIDASEEQVQKVSAMHGLLALLNSVALMGSNKDTFDPQKFQEATSAITNNAIPFLAELKKDSELDQNLKALIEVDKDILKKFDTIIELIKKFDTLSKVAVTSKLSNIGLKGIVEGSKYIKMIIGNFADVDKETLDKAKESIDMFKKLVITSVLILILGAFAMKFIDIGNLLLFTATLSAFLFAITGVFKSLSKSLENSMDGAKDAIMLIAASSLIMIIGSKLMEFVDPLAALAFTAALWAFLEMISSIFNNNAEAFQTAMEGAKDAMLIVGLSALILVLGANLLKPKDFFSALLFTVTLGLFLAGLMFIFQKIVPSEGLKNLVGTAEDIALIVGISGLTLMLGALFARMVDPAALFMFALDILILIAGTMMTLSIFADQIKDAKETAWDVAILIGVSGMVMLLAGMIAGMINPVMLLLFEVELLALIGGVLFIYAFASKRFKKAMKGAWEIAVLVGVSGMTLILAGLLVKYINIGKLFLFTLILGAFIASILLVYSIASAGFKHAFKGAKEFLILIGVSALILILGTLVVQKWIDIPSLLAFTVILAGFIIAIGFTYKLMGKTIKKALLPAILMAVLVAISGAVLLLGASFIADNPNLIWGSIAFILLVIGFVAVISVLCIALGAAKKEIMKGMVPLAMILGITYLSTLVIDSISDVASKEGFLLNILKGVAAIAGVILAVGGIAIAAGALLFGPQAILFALGLGAVTSIVGLALLAAQAVKNIAIAMMYMNAVEKFDPGIMIDNIKGFVEIAKEMKPLADSFTVIWKTSMAISMMSAALSSIAQTVQDWADLKIPVYEGTKIVEYETITGDMFPKAAENIKKVVKTLGEAIIEIYNEKPEIFDGQGFLGLGQSKFAIVSKSLKTMGPMLSSIAKGIKNWAKLTIPIYEGTKITGYETITGDMFQKAAQSIKDVITTLGQAIVDAYDMKPELFESEGFFGLGSSKFAKVTKSLQSMGPMLCSIAKGISKWADLKIPVYTGTEITGYETMTGNQFKQAATHVKEVIKTLGEAIIETYDECEGDDKRKGMFDSTGFLGLGKSKFAKVTNAFKTMGPMLTSIADGIIKWADLKIPQYDSKGNISGYFTIKDKEFEEAAKNIKAVLKCIGEALVEVVENNPKIFGDSLLADAPAIVAANAMKVMGETLNLTANAVASYASGIFPVFDTNGNYVKDITVTPDQYKDAADNIKTILSCIGQALVEVVKDPNNKELFNEGVFSDAPAAIAAEAIKNMSEALHNSVTAISKLADLDLNELHTALDPNGPEDNIYHRLNDLLTFTVDIYRLFVSEDSSMATTGKVRHWWRSDTVEKMSFAEYLDEHNGDVEDANEALETFTGMLSKMLEKYVDIGKVITENEAPLKVFEGGPSSQIYNYMLGAMNSVTLMIRMLTTESYLDLFDNIEDEEDDITDGMDSIMNIVENFLDRTVSISKLYRQLRRFDLTDIVPVIRSFNSCVQALSKIGESDSNDKFFNINIPKIDSNSVSKEIKIFSDSLEQIIYAAEYAEEVGEEGYNILRDGILKIYEVTESIDENKHFRNHVKDLKNFVKTVNNVQLNKLNSLTTFVDAMNILSSRLGNLDNLTDAIANNLSAVLYELVTQLRKADASINNAHELQEKRKKLIEESLKKVEKIMDKPMIVEITQKVEEEGEDDQTQTQQEGRVNGTTVTSDDADGTEVKITSNDKMESPDNAVANRGEVSNAPYALTMEQFRSFMMSEYDKVIDKLIKANKTS